MQAELHPKNYSFEYYPPKTLEGASQLIKSATALSVFAPRFFSITFGAGGSTREGTIEMAKLLQQKTKVAIAPHLAGIGLDRTALTGLILQYQSLGMNRLVALRGDLPTGMMSEGEFNRGYELVKLIRAVSGDHFHIEVAAYPEFHPQAKNALYDVFNLKRKYEAGANSAITQYFFNSDAYFYFLDECARQAIDLPIIPGIMPITNFERLVRFSKMCGAEIPNWLFKRLEAYGSDQESLQAFGLEFVTQLCERLLSGGAPSLHFYTLNQARICIEIVKQLNVSYDSAANIA